MQGGNSSNRKFRLMMVRHATRETHMVDLLDRTLDKAIVIDLWAPVALAGADFGIERKTAVQENTNVALLGRKKKEAERLGYAALRLRRVRLDSKAAILIKLLASTAAPTSNSKRSRPSARQRFMPRPRNSTEMRPSMPARKRCPFLKSDLFSYASRLAVFFPPHCGMHTTLTPSCLRSEER